MKAIVIGCGVIGLTTAITLQEQNWQVIDDIARFFHRPNRTRYWALEYMCVTR